MRVALGFGLALLAFPAWAASSCDYINFPRFEPDQLKRCIDELKSELEVRRAQALFLESMVCNLALDLRQLRGAAGNELVGIACPAIKKKK